MPGVEKRESNPGIASGRKRVLAFMESTNEPESTSAMRPPYDLAMVDMCT